MSQLYTAPPAQRGPLYVREDIPAYRVLAGKFFGPDDSLYDEGTAPLYYDGEPNLNLEPINKLAREEYKKFIDRLNAQGQEAKALNPNAMYTAYPNPYEETVSNGKGRKVQVGDSSRNAPVFPSGKKATKVKVFNDINAPEYLDETFEETIQVNGKPVKKSETAKGLNEAIGKSI